LKSDVGVRCLSLSSIRPSRRSQLSRAVEPGDRSGEWISCAVGDRSGRADDRGLEPARGVEVVAGPDDADGDGVRPAVGAAEVAAYRIDQAAFCECVVLERLGNVASGGEGGREGFVPASHALAAGAELAAGGGAIASGAAVVALPQIEHRIGGEAQPGGSREQAGHVGERDRFRASFGKVAAESVVEAP
jgi:hypothetical protein